MLVKGFYALEEDTTDVMFIGGSGFYRSVSPPLMYTEQGFTSYNFCSAAFLFDSALLMVKEAEKKQHPSLYVIDIRRFYKEVKKDISGENDEDDNIEKQKSHMSYVINNMPLSLNRAKQIHEFFGKKLGTNEFEWQFDYMRTHNNWKELTAGDISEFFTEMFNFKEYNAAAYNGIICGPWHTAFKRVEIEKFNKKVILERDSLALLDEFTDYVKKHKLNVLFCVPPYIVSEENYAYERYLQDYLEAQGFNFLNGNEMADLIGIDYATDFYDENHLNAMGCLKFSPSLASYISENYNLEKKEMTPEQQKDWEEMYTDWNALAQKYVKKIIKDCEKDND